MKVINKSRLSNIKMLKMPRQILILNYKKYMVPSLIIFTIVILRISMIFVPLNYDYPDQYWQGPQIAYKIYNKIINNEDIGFQTWQWTIDQPIRNPVYQYLLVLGYIVIHGVKKLIGFGQQNYGFFLFINEQHIDRLMQLGPKMIQSMLSIMGDIFMVKFFLLNFENNKNSLKVSTFSILLLLTNWFYFSMLSRTYINSFQCILTTISFYYWQLHYISNRIKIEKTSSLNIITKNDIKSRLIVLLAYMSRPTSLIPWMVIWPYEMIDYLLRLKKKKQTKQCLIKIVGKIILKNLIQIILMILSSFIIGSLYYHKLTLTQWNFFYYNVVLKWSNFFETHSFHFYFTQSIPFMEVGYVLFLCVGLWKGLKWVKDDDETLLSLQDRINKQMFRTICWFTISLLIIQTFISQHKEHRFLLILEPFLMIVKLKGFLVIQKFFTKSDKRKSKIFYFILSVIILINVFMFWSIALYPKGGFNLLREVRSSIDRNQQIGFVDDSKTGIMYLCESHALPAYSIILRNLIILLPDESPMAKMNNQCQIDKLKQNPQEVYQKFINKILQKYGSQKVKFNFIVLQQKFVSIQINKDLKSSAILSQQWKFIEKEYRLKNVENNRNFWEQIIFGPDKLYLYQRKQLTNIKL